MSSARTRWFWRLTVLAVAGVSLFAVGVAVVVPRLNSFGAGIHQRAITREMQQWAEEYRSLEDVAEAGYAIGMLEYIPDYYPVQEGYRSDPVTETALEQQRTDTMAAIISGLQDFSSKDYGADIARWKEWHLSQTGSK